jgi:biopolymer transport protein ExbD
MKIRHSTLIGDEKIEIQMTPMIDIVFQLLVFFIMTFRIGAMEGDFNIKMPLAAEAGAPDTSQIPPLKLQLSADANGELQLPFVLNDQGFESWPALTAYIADLVGDERGPGSVQESAEVELHADYHLRYEYVVQAMDAVSGRIDPATGAIIKLIEKIKFAPQTSGG